MAEPTRDPTPPPLDYFAPQEPERRRQRGVVTWSIALLASWLPYLCGIVNASTAAQSFVSDVTRAHLNATIVLLALGLALSATCLVQFARMRHLAGSIAATGVFVMQCAVAGCVGFAV